LFHAFQARHARGGGSVPQCRVLEHFQQKCEAVLRPEMRLKQRDRAVLPIPQKPESL
jgi:hypothetical protein